MGRGSGGGFAFHARKAHQAIDEPAHVFFFDRHRAEDLARDLRLFDRAAAQHVDVAGDYGERCAQSCPASATNWRMRASV